MNPATQQAWNEGAQRAVNQAVEKLYEVSDFYRVHDLANPALYRLDRVIAWLGVAAPPPAEVADRFLRAGNVAYGHENFFSVLKVETLLKLDDISVNDSFGKRIHGFSPGLF